MPSEARGCGMRDTELYKQLLGIRRPWYVREVRYTKEPEEIHVYVDHERGILLPCPECDEYSPVYDHKEERQWRHLNTCHVPTFIHACLPRIRCKRHGVKSILSEWSEPGSDMTMRFEQHVIDLEKECSIEGVSRLTGLSWDRGWTVMERAVQRGMRRKKRRLPKVIGVDEKSFARRHKYETLVCDMKRGTIEYVGDTRRQSSLAKYYNQFSRKEREQVEAVAMDMWDPYIAATKEAIPEAEKKIVFDKFHVVRLMTNAVDTVRKREHKGLMKENLEYLKGTKFLWLCNKENIPKKRRHEFRGLRRMDLKVGRAWAIKENLRHLWNYRHVGWAMRFFRKWYFWATHSRLKAVIKAAKTINRHLKNILTYLKHRITNALAEGLNAKIEKIKRMACGYRNRGHYRTVIYFHCGGLDVYPRLRHG
jgi:transposase